MRLSMDNYLKAFPRSEKPIQQPIRQGNVIEEAEKAKPSKAADPSTPGNVIEGAAPAGESEEGAEDGDAGLGESDSQ